MREDRDRRHLHDGGQAYWWPHVVAEDLDYMRGLSKTYEAFPDTGAFEIF